MFYITFNDDSDYFFLRSLSLFMSNFMTHCVFAQAKTVYSDGTDGGDDKNSI